MVYTMIVMVYTMVYVYGIYHDTYHLPLLYIPWYIPKVVYTTFGVVYTMRQPSRCGPPAGPARRLGLSLVETQYDICQPQAGLTVTGRGGHPAAPGRQWTRTPSRPGTRRRARQRRRGPAAGRRRRAPGRPPRRGPPRLGDTTRGTVTSHGGGAQQ
jgi:hypothetical protein